MSTLILPRRDDRLGAVGTHDYLHRVLASYDDAPEQSLIANTNGSISAQFGLIAGSGAISASAILEAASTTKGFLPPRMTTTQRNAISSPADGLVIYNTTTAKLTVRQNGAWVEMGSGGGGASAFIELSDVPQSYSGQATFFVRVDSGEVGLEFFDILAADNSWSGDNTFGGRGTFFTSEREVAFNIGSGSAIKINPDVGGVATIVNFYQNNGEAFTGLQAPESANNIVFRLMGSDGSLGDMIVTDGNGNLSFATPSGGGGLTVGTSTITGGSTTRILFNNAGVLGEYTISGSGTVAMTTSPVFTTPNIGSATGSISGNAGTATILATGRTISISGDLTYTSPSFNGSGNVTAVGTLASIISAGGPTGSATVAPIITWDAKGRLTAVSSATITPAVGSITGLGTGVATALAVNVGSAGAFVTFNGALGTPSSATLTSATGLPVSTGISGLGTGVATALAVNIGSAGALVALNGALGTPSSGTGTNITGIPAANILAGTLGTGAYTMDTRLTVPQIVNTSNAIAASGNAATVPITYRVSTVTNNSAATLTITMTTTSAVDGMLVMVRILDFSAAAQTIAWVNTENSTVTAPTTSNGSTTLPLTVGFQYNSATSKWRCIASA